MIDYTPTTATVRERFADGFGLNYARALEDFDRWIAAHDAEKRAEWEAEQGWEYAIGAQSEDRPGKFWRDSDWDTTTELHEALGDLEDALPVFSNAVVIRRRPSTPWLPVPDTTNNEGRAEHDLDRMGICTRCGHGITARELLDGDEQCTTNNESEGKA